MYTVMYKYELKVISLSNALISTVCEFITLHVSTASMLLGLFDKDAPHPYIEVKLCIVSLMKEK